MDKVSAFLANNPVSVFTVLLPGGVPHSAALHFSHSDGPLRLYFSTSLDSVKVEGLKDGQTQPASAVVGWSEQEFITLQLRGKARKLEGDELEKAKGIHYAKHPGSAKYADDPDTFFIVLDVDWFRYTDFKVAPMEILSSEG